MLRVMRAGKQHDRLKKKSAFAVWMFALGPLLIPILSSLAALVLRIQVGEWDFIMVDESHGHGPVVILIILFTVFLTILFWMMVLYLPLKELKFKQRVFQMLTHILSWIIAFSYCQMDPLGYLDWWKD
jgi:hypothetical protein